jgi:hypothetical protein
MGELLGGFWELGVWVSLGVMGILLGVSVMGIPHCQGILLGVSGFRV